MSLTSSIAQPTVKADLAAITEIPPYKGGGGPAYAQSFFNGLGKFSLARLSTAKYYNAQGILTSAGLNVPRFDYDPATLQFKGLLEEPLATNVALQSDTLLTTPWAATSAVLTGDNAADPTGGTNSTKIASNSSGTINRTQQIFSSSASTYTLSAYLSAGNVNFAFLMLTVDAINYVAVSINLGTQGLTNLINGTGYTIISSAIQKISASIYRVQLTATIPANASMVALIGPASSGALISTSGDFINGWGAQIEQSLSATSYITTATSSGSRQADVFSIPVANIAFNPNASTIVCGATWGGFNVSSPRLIGTNGIGAQAIPGIQQLTSPSALSVFDSGGSPVTGNTISANVPFKCAVAWDVGAAKEKIVLNGSTVVSNSIGIGFTDFTKFYLGSSSGTSNFCGPTWFTYFAYYNYTLSDSQFQAATAS